MIAKITCFIINNDKKNKAKKHEKKDTSKIQAKIRIRQQWQYFWD